MDVDISMDIDERVENEIMVRSKLKVYSKGGNRGVLLGEKRSRFGNKFVVGEEEVKEEDVDESI